MQIIQKAKKIISQNSIPFLIVLSIFLWIYFLRRFLTGELAIESDAISYYDHIKYYIDNLAKGIYPMWDPTWWGGFSNEFFLRRIGAYNPFLFLILIFRAVGIPHLQSYMAYLTIYYFVGMVGFYLLAKEVVGDKRVAFVAYLLLTFSSLGARLFDSYFHLIVVPMIWFFYFLLSFSKKPKKVFLLGMIFCLMNLATTYIPFYFLTIFLIFVIFFFVFYFFCIPTLFKRYFQFIRKNKIFTLFCVFALCVSMLPGLIFYKSVKNRDVVMPWRNYNFSHTPSPFSSELEVDIENAVTWAILEDITISWAFDDLRKFRYSFVYLSLFVFILFLTGLFTKVDRKMLLLFSWGLFMFVMGSPYKTNLYTFLRQHIFYFKYFRNLHFFLWFAILPILILFLSMQFKKVLEWKFKTKAGNVFLYCFITIVHAGFIYFLYAQKNALLSSFLSVFLSYVFFILYFSRTINPKGGVFLTLILLVVCIQPMEVFYYLQKNAKKKEWLFKYEEPYRKFSYQRDIDPQKLDKKLLEVVGTKIPVLYVGSKWINLALDNMNGQIFNEYLRYRLVAYDRVNFVKEDKQIFSPVQFAVLKNSNVAYISGKQVNEDYALLSLLDKERAKNKPLRIEKAGQGIEVLNYNSNTLKLKTNFSHPKFLVYNDSFHREWKAFINGKRAHLYRANIAFKGIFVAAGEQIIRFHYGKPWRYPLNIFLLVFYYGIFFYLLGLAKSQDKKEFLEEL